MIKIYELPNILLNDEPIPKNVMGGNIYWKEGRSLTYRDVKNRHICNNGRKAGQIRIFNKRERTNSLFHFFR